MQLQLFKDGSPSLKKSSVFLYTLYYLPLHYFRMISRNIGSLSKLKQTFAAKLNSAKPLILLDN